MDALDAKNMLARCDLESISSEKIIATNGASEGLPLPLLFVLLFLNV